MTWTAKEKGKKQVKYFCLSAYLKLKLSAQHKSTVATSNKDRRHQKHLYDFKCSLCLQIIGKHHYRGTTALKSFKYSHHSVLASVAVSGMKTKLTSRVRSTLPAQNLPVMYVSVLHFPFH